ncbi:MAG TPA: 3-dehydroquinate synthase [Pirellulaceae bacterium]|jgi:3-dehydroquinate synthase|nr:3-dehydroquinate synthase [Pirellulaceae bacterium]
MEPIDAVSRDYAFAVPFTHRFRVTRDVLGKDTQTLADLLEPTNDRGARAQFWIDQNVLDANPDLPQRIRAFAKTRDHIEMVGNLQVVPGGEAIKNDVHILERMLKVFNAADLDRRSYVVVIGGGAALDTVGFAVAIAHRGLRLVRIPTTTLGQADSGVGVKNGVNLFQKKNWLGSFAVPWGVVNDLRMLETLPDREFVSGFSEAVKVSLLKSPAFFDELCTNAEAIRRREESAFCPALEQSAHWHLRHITQGGDPFEALEARPLDYGHWSAHKMEPLSDFRLLHGEAVGIGVAIDTVYSSLKFGFPESRVRDVLACMSKLGLPLDHETLENPAALFRGLEEFRQHLGGRLTLTMLHDVGKPFEVHEVDYAAMREAIGVVRAFVAEPA